MAIIGVMGSGTKEWPELTTPLGIWLAENGYDLLTGGGQGVMLSVARAFFNTKGRTGRSIGILPSQPHPNLGFVSLPGYPNPFVDLPILTPLPRREASTPDDAVTRNHINVLASDVIIALPGEYGTLDEIRLARSFAKPLLGFGPAEAFGAFPESVEVTSDFGVVQEFIGRFPFH